MALSASERSIYTIERVAGLPEPARRYFNFTIKPGTTLTSTVQIEMRGELGMGSQAKPKYKPMQAQQLLTPPYGFIWRVKSGSIVGSDGALPHSSWTRFWLLGIFPIVRVGGQDHHRSAFGRMVSEAAIWAPASLLPSAFVQWEPLDGDSARAIVSYGDFTQAVDITVDASGAPTKVLVQRWSNENPEETFREQPFGGYLSKFREFGGYTLPTLVEGGNLIGTPDYFPFYKADAIDIRFPNLPVPVP